MDSKRGALSKYKYLIKNEESGFWIIGQRNRENEQIDDDLTEVDGARPAPEFAGSTRAHVDVKKTVQTVQLSKSAKSPLDNNGLSFGQSLDSGVFTVQNPSWLQDANLACPPGDVPPGRWRQFLADARAFAESPWAERAAALGWTEADLYGADDIRPFARRDKAGLLRLLNGDRLVALTEDTAVIETRIGARQRFHRRRYGV